MRRRSTTGLESIHSTEELSVQETEQDVFQDSEVDGPLLELLQTQGSLEANQETVPDSQQQDTATKTQETKDQVAQGIRQGIMETTGNILEVSMQGPVDRKLTTLTTLVYSLGNDRFGLEEGKARKEPPRPNRQQTCIKNPRRELRQLKRRYCDRSPREDSTDSGKADGTVIADLTTECRNTRRKARERAKKSAAFTANPYNFARSLLVKERSGKLQTPLKEVEKYLHATHFDPSRKDLLGNRKRKTQQTLQGSS